MWELTELPWHILVSKDLTRSCFIQRTFSLVCIPVPIFKFAKQSDKSQH